MRGRYYTIYIVEYKSTIFGGKGGWHIDGERGHCTYPNTFTKEEAIEAYKKGE